MLGRILSTVRYVIVALLLLIAAPFALVINRLLKSDVQRTSRQQADMVRGRGPQRSRAERRRAAKALVKSLTKVG